MRLLVLSGGRHPYHESTLILGDFLTKAGHAVTITDDAEILTHAAHRALPSGQRGAAGVLQAVLRSKGSPVPARCARASRLAT